MAKKILPKVEVVKEVIAEEPVVAYDGSAVVTVDLTVDPNDPRLK
jgi:hypothetical protein